MSGADVFAGFVAGVVVASVIWALWVGRLLGRAADEIEALEAAWRDVVSEDVLDDLDEWSGWGDVPPIPPHGGVG